MEPDLSALDRRLKAEHDGDDWPLLSRLHEQAAAVAGTDAERRFSLTHAWVYALVDGDAERVDRLEARLRELGGL